MQTHGEYKMGKLHELIAAEEDLKGLHKKTLAETVTVFNNKASHFEESIQVFDSTQEGSETETEKHTPMVTTVGARLDYQGKQSGKYIDAMLQKETANTKAIADIELPDGSKLAEGVPVTALLGLERELKQIRLAYGLIPVLDPGKVWDDVAAKFGKDVVQNVAPKKIRTQKITEPLTLAPATDRHPAQVQMIHRDILAGHTTTTTRSSKYSSAHKHECLERVDTLITAVKTARMRANLQNVEKTAISNKLFNYINKGNIK